MELLTALWEKIKVAVLDGSLKIDHNYHECQMCLNSGWAETFRTFYGRQYRGVIKCQTCNYWHTGAVIQTEGKERAWKD